MSVCSKCGGGWSVCTCRTKDWMAEDKAKDEIRASVRDTIPGPWLSKDGTHLGGPDDTHYAVLGIQPIDAVEAWSLFWPKRVIYHLAEAVYMIARCGTKQQTLRDLKKAHFLLGRAIGCLEQEESVSSK